MMFLQLVNFLNLMQLTTPRSKCSTFMPPQLVELETIMTTPTKYPALVIGLSPYIALTSPSHHQLVALSLAAKILDCDSSQILSLCAIRPSPSFESTNWLIQSKEWQSEHKLSTEDLSAKYVARRKENLRIADQLALLCQRKLIKI
jgi:hypothetical protein